jgi:hypothetical protein
MSTETDVRPAEALLTRVQAASLLTEHGYPTAPATLAKLACERIGGGPVFLKYGSRPLYAPSDLLRWAATRSRGVGR